MKIATRNVIIGLVLTCQCAALVSCYFTTARPIITETYEIQFCNFNYNNTDQTCTSNILYCIDINSGYCIRLKRSLVNKTCYVFADNVYIKNIAHRFNCSSGRGCKAVISIDRIAGDCSLERLECQEPRNIPSTSTTTFSITSPTTVTSDTPEVTYRLKCPDSSNKFSILMIFCVILGVICFLLILLIIGISVRLARLSTPNIFVERNMDVYGSSGSNYTG